MKEAFPDSYDRRGFAARTRSAMGPTVGAAARLGRARPRGAARGRGGREGAPSARARAGGAASGAAVLEAGAEGNTE